MLRNHLKIALRSLAKHKVYSAINILGLAVGLACCLVILLYINDERSYDRFHADADRIHRVVKDFISSEGDRLPDATTPPALAPALEANVPEIEQAIRLFPSWGRKYLVHHGDDSFYEESVYMADADIFDLFTFSMISGDVATALQSPESVVITKSTAEKYFGNAEPMGKVLEIDGRGSFSVTGVIEDIPMQSHFHFDFLLPVDVLAVRAQINLDEAWGFYNFYTYIKLKPNTDIAQVEPKIVSVFKENNPENLNEFYTQALTDIHLDSDLKWELEPNGSRSSVRIFGIIALFVIFIAGINYVNLATAKSIQRAKEIGVRKATGADRQSLIRQFLVESILVTVLAGIIAVGLTKFGLNFINDITGKALNLQMLTQNLIWLYSLGGIILLGLLAGIYPAFYLSSFDPVEVLKGDKTSLTGGFALRNALVVLQFSISIALIVGIVTVNRQMDYLQHKNLGLDKDHVLVIPNTQNLTGLNALKTQLRQVPGITEVAAANGVVGGQNWTTTLRSRGAASGTGQLINFLVVDYDYTEVLEMNFVEGRGFSPEFPGDTLDAVILNERAIQDLGVKQPAVGKQLVLSEDEDTTVYARIVGVLEDFHFTSMRNEIKPFAFFLDTGDGFDNLTVQFTSENVDQTLAQIETTFRNFAPDRPFEYYFLDETFEQHYRAEQSFQQVVSAFTIFALFIACLGLFGLSAYATERRTKEIGIRKVLGASVTNIVTMLSTDFLKLVLISALIAFPIAWWAMSTWLAEFAYRTELSWWIFAVAGMASILIALVTISFQAIRAALANPVESLKTE